MGSTVKIDLEQAGQYWRNLESGLHSIKDKGR